MTLLDESRPRRYINVLTEAYRVGFNSGLTLLFPGVDKVCLSLAGRPPLQACLTSMPDTKKVLYESFTELINYWQKCYGRATDLRIRYQNN